MPSRSVLVTYSPSTNAERNKVVSIPEEANETDLEYLEKKCMTLFSFGSNVNIRITFQKFDVDWDCFIDLEDDFVAQHKDRLRIVVTPCLQDCPGTPSLSNTAESDETSTAIVDSTPVVKSSSSAYPKRLCVSSGSSPSVSSVLSPICGTLPEEMSVSGSREESEDGDIVMSSSKRRKLILDSDDDDDATSSDVKCKPNDAKSKYVLKKLPNLISKTEDDNVPLPDPFELPKNFRPDVASALKLGKMTLDTNRAFLSTVAASMFVFKKYPTSEDYNNVARSIVNKYPFMKAPTGKPYGAIVMGLKNRFKERRRTKKPRKPAAETLLPNPQKSPTVKNYSLPQIPVGEDETSYDRHNRVLKAEFAKASPNVSNVKELMKVTYPMRRREILAIGHKNDYNALGKFPFLQVPDHILDEFSRITGEKNIVDSCRRVWNQYVSKIIQQARLEKGTRVLNTVSELLEDEKDEGNAVIALCLLNYLLPDSRSKPNVNRVLMFCQVSENIRSMASTNQDEPFVIIVGDHKEPQQSFLVIDRKIVSEIKTDDIPIFLLAAFYIFNIRYPTGCHNLYKFFEVAFLNIIDPVTTSVKNFLARLSCN